MKTKEEINKQIDIAQERRENGEGYFGMTYEEGVMAALEWVIESTDITPFE